MSSAHLDVAIEGARKELEEIVADLKSDPRLSTIRKLHTAMNQLEDLADRPRTSIASLLDFGMSDGGQSTTETRSISVSPHEFFGMEPLEAAKLYLKKVGPVRKSAMFDEIVTAIRSGGGDPGNEDKLRISLSRSTFEVAKISDDRYGLLEFFPHVKRGTPGRKKKPEGDVPVDAVEEPTPEAPEKETAEAGSPETA